MVTAQDWRTVIDVNLNGTYHLVHAVLPQMRAQQDGLIINVTSIAGKRTISTLAGSSYCASKFAMNSLGEAINLEEYENGIRERPCPLPTYAQPDQGQRFELSNPSGTTINLLLKTKGALARPFASS